MSPSSLTACRVTTLQRLWCPKAKVGRLDTRFISRLARPVITTRNFDIPHRDYRHQACGPRLPAFSTVKNGRDHTTMAPGTAARPSGVVADDPLVWIDCEMTGLNPDTEEIIEIYCILTNGNLEIIDQEGYHAVIHYPASRLDRMDEWCTRTHGNSGLTAAVLASSTTPEQAAEGLYNYITKHVPDKRRALLAGNSVHADRAFLRKEPYAKVVDHLHYRILDISTIKEAARRWSPREVMAQAPTKKGNHLARDDILESIEEARHYRDAIFRQPS